MASCFLQILNLRCRTTWEWLDVCSSSFRSVPSALDIHFLLLPSEYIDKSWIFHASKYLIMPWCSYSAVKVLDGTEKFSLVAKRSKGEWKACKVIYWKPEKYWTLNITYKHENWTDIGVMWAVCDFAKYRIQFSKTSDSRTIMNSIVLHSYAEAVVPLIWQFWAQTSLTFATTIEFMTMSFFPVREISINFRREQASKISTKTTHTSTWKSSSQFVLCCERTNELLARRL